MSQQPNNDGSFSSQNYGYNDGNTQWHMSSMNMTFNSSQQGVPDFATLQQQHQAMHNASVQATHGMRQGMLPGHFMSPALPQPPQRPAMMPPPGFVEPEQGYGQAQAFQQAPPQTYQQPQPQAYPQQQPPMQRPMLTDGREYASTQDVNQRLNNFTNAANREKQQLDEHRHQTDARLQQIEQESADTREMYEADRAASQAREKQMQQQLYESEQRRQQDLADMAQRHAASNQQAAASMDMNALKKVVEELGRNQLSPHDLRQLVGSAVQIQLAGVATGADMQAATAQVQQGLSNMPQGATRDQVQHAVQQTIEDVVSNFANSRQCRSRMVEAAPSQAGIAQAGHAGSRITEPSNDQQTVMGGPSHSGHRSKRSNAGSVASRATTVVPTQQLANAGYAPSYVPSVPPRQLPAPSVAQSVAPSYLPPPLQTGGDSRSTASRHSKSRAPVSQAPAPSEARSTISLLDLDNLRKLGEPTSTNSGNTGSQAAPTVAPWDSFTSAPTRVGVKKAKSTASKGSRTTAPRITITPAVEKVISQPAATPAMPQLYQPSTSGSKNSTASVASVQPGSHNAITPARHQTGYTGYTDDVDDLDFPDNASQVPDYYKQKAAKQGSSGERPRVGQSHSRQLEAVPEEDDRQSRSQGKSRQA